MSELHDKFANREYYRHKYDAEPVLDPGIVADYAIHFRRFAAKFALEPGQRVLDIGCGKGYWLRQVAPAVRQVVGIDISEPGLRVARAMTHAQFVSGDVLVLPFKAECFDRVFAFEVFEHTVDPELAVREAHRILKRDGLLILLQQFRLDDYQRVQEALSRAKARLLRRSPRATMPLEALHINQLQPPQWRDLLQKCGFDPVESFAVSVLPPLFYVVPRLRQRFYNLPGLTRLDRWLCTKRWLSARLALSFFYVAHKATEREMGLDKIRA